MAAQKGLEFLLKGADSQSEVTISNVNTTSEVITTGVHGWSTGQPVEFFTTDTLPDPLVAKTIYYINVKSTTTFTVHTTLADAQGDTSAVDLTDSGAGTNTVQAITTLAGMRSTTMSLSNEVVDVTTKDSSNARTILAAAGTQALQMNAAGVFTDADVEEDFRGYAFARSLNRLHLFFGNGDTLSADFYIGNYQREGEYNGAEMYSMTLESSGTLTYTGL